MFGIGMGLLRRCFEIHMDSGSALGTENAMYFVVVLNLLDSLAGFVLGGIVLYKSSPMPTEKILPTPTPWSFESEGQ